MELKRRMTFDEVSQHMKEHTFKLPSRVSVGRYAKQLGFKVYKPMVDGKMQFYYVNDAIPSNS
ncbi:MAG: hypothetical protein EZS26_001018 [Candidatus Ordinivivax streblomastigis]|jgi:hypothetical protein|uniref:Uncharacterized protein n=1 Tax=Candidatus Ordinivivax streblomastigis TaxID=2540710 RepID=A0A5M8P391_9BACT|nr:MAG: hypothetical protein EZS26_001018 [Candidatus Ordinivivax streblomastigis]